MTNRPIDDGGPAFPCPEIDFVEPWFGMSLRDYFAGQAMPVLMTMLVEHRNTLFLDGETWDEMVARNAYDTADALIKFRGESQ